MRGVKKAGGFVMAVFTEDSKVFQGFIDEVGRIAGDAAGYAKEDSLWLFCSSASRCFLSKVAGFLPVMCTTSRRCATKM